MSAARPQPAERRSHYRVETTVKVRLRPAGEGDAPRTSDPVAAFEELAVVATRFRKEASATGRIFVDRLMATLDALVGESSQGPSADWCPALVVSASLSAGGVGFRWNREHALGTELDVEFTIESEQSSSVPFKLRCRVRRCHPTDGEFDLGVEFLQVPTATQQRLVRLLFDLQRVQLRSRGGRG